MIRRSHEPRTRETLCLGGDWNGRIGRERSTGVRETLCLGGKLGMAFCRVCFSPRSVGGSL